MWLLNLSFAAELTFVVVGDTQTAGAEDSINFAVFPQIVEDMNAHDPDVGLFVGDLVGGSGSLTATVDQWQDFNATIADFEGHALLVPGNHDVYGGAGTFDAWRETFAWLPVDDSPPGEEGVSYVYDVGTTRFISITSDQEVSNPYNVSSEGMVWLDRVLSESQSFEQIFVMTHHPVSFSDEGGLGTTGGDFWQTLVAYDVTGIFAGHWHRYQPGQLGNGGATWETIIGTGGGWMGFEPIREYQQRYGYLVVKVDGPEAHATFYADDDGDGHYDDPVHDFVMRSATPRTPGLVATAALTTPEIEGVDVEFVLTGDAEFTDEGLEVHGGYAEGGSLDVHHLVLLGELTLAFEVRLDTPSSGEWDAAMTCFATNDYYSEDEQSNYAWWLNVEADGTLRAFWEYEDGNNVSVFSSESAGLDDEWHHVTLTRTEDEVRFYVDGVLLGEPQGFDRLPTGASRGMLYLGADTDGDYPMDGALRNFQVHDRALSDEEVLALVEEEPKDTAPPEDTDADSDPDDDSTPIQPQPACGCSAGTSAPLWLGVLLLLARRKEKRHPPFGG